MDNDQSSTMIYAKIERKKGFLKSVFGISAQTIPVKFIGIAPHQKDHTVIVSTPSFWDPFKKDREYIIPVSCPKIHEAFLMAKKYGDKLDLTPKGQELIRRLTP